MVSLPIAAALLAVAGVGDTVLLDFSMEYCGPCKQMEPVVQQLIASGYPVRKVDLGQEPELARRFNVEGAPTFIMLLEGREVDRVVGPTSAARLQEMLQKAKKTEPTSPRNIEDPVARLPVTPTDQPLELQRTRQPGSLFANNAAVSEQPGQLSPSSPDRLIQSSVRIRIQDAGGNSVGTGTIIDTRAGEALILTCGHIFRDSHGKGQITVDLFGSGAPRGLPAELIDFNDKSDVGLLSVRTNWPVVVAHVAPRDFTARAGDMVYSVGCNHGEDPTIRQSKINSLDRYQGPPNIQVAGKPVQGRSGGGLFSAEGLVIGVCNAADEQDNEGLFAGLASIHAQLDLKSLTYVYHAAVPGNLDRSAVTPTSHEAPAQVPLSPVAQGPMTAGLFQNNVSQGGTPSQLTSREEATLAAIQSRADNAEVVVIIRPLNKPEAKSEVIVLDKASSAFRNQLLSAAKSAP